MDCSNVTSLLGSALHLQGSIDVCFTALRCRMERQPDGIFNAVKMLTDGLIGVSTCVTLNSLAVLHELLSTDPRIMGAVQAIDNMHSILRALQSVKNTGLGHSAETDIRMLAAEIDEKCFGNVDVMEKGTVSARGVNYPIGVTFVTVQELAMQESDDPDSCKISVIPAGVLCRVMAHSRVLDSPRISVEWEGGLGWVNCWESAYGPMFHQRWPCREYLQELHEPLAKPRREQIEKLSEPLAVVPTLGVRFQTWFGGN